MADGHEKEKNAVEPAVDEAKIATGKGREKK